MLDEIYATGVRNTVHLAFDVNPADLSVGGVYSGKLVAADVGQSNIEEVNVIEAGDNLGWNLMEGSFFYDAEFNQVSPTPFPSITLPAGFDPVDPVLKYDHDEGISVTGGFVYRGDEVPELAGKYVFGDFSNSFFAPSGRLFVGDLDTGEIDELIVGAGRDAFDLFIKGFGRDADGEIYVLAGSNLGPFRDDAGASYGRILRITAVPEPLSAAALLAAAGPVLLRRRRRVHRIS